jgi:hypothetical protein
VLQWSELTIVMVIPQKAGFGKARVQVNDDDCNAPPLAPDGVIIPDIVEWYTSAQPGDFMVAAHELGHQILGLDDIYSVPDVSRAGLLSLMALAVEASGSVSTTSHLDPLQKLALGWVTPQIVDQTGSYAVEDVKLSDTVFVLPRYRTDPMLPWFGSRGQEYYLVENRQQGLAGLYDAAIDDSGIAVWHVATEPNDNAKTPRGIAAATWTAMDQTQARRGLRLLKRFGSYVAGTNTATVQPGGVLWDMFGVDFMSGTCNNAFPDNFMSWADCTPSGYGLRFLSGPANTMNVKITVP